MAAKILVLTIFCLVGVYNLSIGKFGSLENSFQGSSTDVGAYGNDFEFIITYKQRWLFVGISHATKNPDPGDKNPRDILKVKNPEKIPGIKIPNLRKTPNPGDKIPRLKISESRG